jgi:hypothetical protein
MFQHMAVAILIVSIADCASEVAPEAARWAGGGGPFVYILAGVIGDPKRGAQERMIY